MDAVTPASITSAGPLQAFTPPLTPEALDPMHWLGAVAGQVVGDAWMLAMLGLWSAGLTVLRTAFTAVDALSTPDLSAAGPLRPALETTLWVGGTLVLLLAFVQLALIAVRRDGQSLGRLILGAFQFGFVWVAFLGAASTALAASSGLSRGILQATLHVDALSAIDWTSSWPRNVTDTATATVLGVTALFLVIPGAFFDILISFVAEAALLVLVATSPITAAGLVNESTKAWFWKTLRWFLACVLISPTSALVFGVGVGISKGVVGGNGDQATAAVGTAVVGAVLVIVGACAPLALFRLLAFVDPATPSGAAMRQTWADAGGLAGGRAAAAGGGGGAGAATAGDGTGRAQGEAHAEATTASRMASALGAFGRGVQLTAAIATRATDLSADILGAAGVGAPSYSMTPADERALRAGAAPAPAGGGGGDGGGDNGDQPGPGAKPPVPPAPTPPAPASGPGSGSSAGAGGGPRPGAGGQSAGGGSRTTGGPGAAGGVVP